MGPRRLALPAVALCALLGGGPIATARAEEPSPSSDERAQQLTDQAVTAYKAGRYEETIDLFKQAYVLRADPTIIYNIARAYDKLNKKTEALEFYRRYLVAENTDAKLRQKAEERVAALQAPEPSQTGGGTGSGGGQTLLSPPVKVPVQPERPSLWKQPRFLAGVGLAGAGVLALGAGAALHGVSANTAAPVLDNSQNDEAQKRATRDSAQGQALGAVVSYAAGAALVAGGVALLVTSKQRFDREQRGTTRTSLVPLLSPIPGGAALVLGGGY